MAEEETKLKLKAEEEDVMSVIFPYERITVQYEKTSKKAKTPCRQTADAVGYDVYSAKTGDIAPGERKKFMIETVTKPALGFHLKIYNQSGLACNEGIIIPGMPLIIDQDYRGEIRVTLWNTMKEPFHVEEGDRIGQVMVDRSYKIFWKPVRELQNEKTAQRSDGFGTTGH